MYREKLANVSLQQNTAESCNKDYICPVHRKWLYLNPLIAFEHLEFHLEQGQELRSKHQFQPSLSNLGSGFEIAKIAIELSFSCRAKVMIQLSSTAILLADSYVKTGQQNKAILSLSEAISTLVNWYNGLNEMQQRIESYNDCLNALKRALSFYSNFAHLQQHSKEITKH